MADITGYALQWNRSAIISGLFEERFAIGAFDKSLREHDVAALWAHDSSRVLGRVKNGSLELKPDRIGLWYRLRLNPDSPLGQEAGASVGRGDVAEVSVGFSSAREEWDDRDDLPKRLITEARLHEISLVLWGAYGDTTSASVMRADTKPAASAALRKAEAAMRARGLL